MDTTKIKLSNGEFALVDKEDFKYLNHWKWQHSKGYAQRTARRNGKHTSLYMAREIMKAPADMLVDHINGNPLDNRKINLRICDRATNNANRHKTSSNTGHLGITLLKGKIHNKYQLQIMRNYKSVYQHRFEHLEIAILARKLALRIVNRGGTYFG